MKFFVLVYNRTTGVVDVRRSYDEGERESAVRERFRLEREYMSQPSIEIALISAESLEVLKRTHSRYFSAAGKLVSQIVDKTTDAG